MIPQKLQFTYVCFCNGKFPSTVFKVFVYRFLVLVYLDRLFFVPST